MYFYKDGEYFLCICVSGYLGIDGEECVLKKISKISDHNHQHTTGHNTTFFYKTIQMIFFSCVSQFCKPKDDTLGFSQEMPAYSIGFAKSKFWVGRLLDTNIF